MDLSLDQPGGYLFVRHVGEQVVHAAGRELGRSFLLMPDRLIENWQITVSNELDTSHVEPLLALQPELVVLGTGSRQIFPAAAFMAGFLRKQIGIEVMDNAAAARTYNLLAGESRRVLAAFIVSAQ